MREDLSPIDVAQACACLIEDFGQSHGELAGRLGRSRPAISNLVRLLELPEGVQELISAGVLTEGHGRAILMADGPARRTRVAERVGGEAACRCAPPRSSPAASRASRRGPRGATGEPTPLGDAALEAFGSAFDTPVRVRTGSRGQVVVELRFADAEALRRARRCERLSAD